MVDFFLLSIRKFFFSCQSENPPKNTTQQNKTKQNPTITKYSHLQIIKTHWFSNFKFSLTLGSANVHFLLSLVTLY